MLLSPLQFPLSHPSSLSSGAEKMTGRQSKSGEHSSSDDEDFLQNGEESERLMPETHMNGTIQINGSKPRLSSSDGLAKSPNASELTSENSVSNAGGAVYYGSVPEKTPDGKKVIYCVHGKPSGCCATLVNGTGNTFPIEVPPSETHCHKERDLSAMNKKARRKLIIASVLCVLFMIAEIIGGVISGSLAIATDAAHLLTDFAAFMISLFAIWVGQRPPTRHMLFGWHRAEVIGALTSVLTIWLVTGILVYVAALRIVSMDFTIDATVMLITSGIGVIVNVIMGLSLHQHSHSHSAPSSDVERVNSPAAHPPEEAKNINVRAAFIHVIGDFIQSTGVFVAALIIYFREDWKIIDPICTFVFSVLVLMTTYSILKDTINVLMEGIPKDIDFNDVLETFLSIEGVVAVHNLRIWALSLGKTALATHVAIDENANASEILAIATRKIHEKYNFFEMTIQIEYFQPKMRSCDQCQVPK